MDCAGLALGGSSHPVLVDLKRRLLGGSGRDGGCAGLGWLCRCRRRWCRASQRDLVYWEAAGPAPAAASAPAFRLLWVRRRRRSSIATTAPAPPAPLAPSLAAAFLLLGLWLLLLPRLLPSLRLRVVELEWGRPLPSFLHPASGTTKAYKARAGQVGVGQRPDALPWSLAALAPQSPCTSVRPPKLRRGPGRGLRGPICSLGPRAAPRRC